MSRVVLIIFLFILYGVLNNTNLPTKKKNKRFVIFASFGLIIDSGFRHLCIGPDTYQYFLMFEEAKQYSFADLFYSTFKIGSYTYIRDAGYWLFQKAFHALFPSYRFYLIFIAILFFVSVGRFIYKNLDDLTSIFVSYLFYIGMFWYFFSTTGCRQTIAVSLLIFAFSDLLNGKFIRYALVVLFCSFLHASAFVAMLGLLVIFIKKKWFFYGLIVSLIPIIYLFRYQLFGFLLSSMSMEEAYGVYLETNEKASSVAVTMLYIIVLILCLVYRKQLSASKNIDYCTKLYIVGMCFLPTMFIAATAMRTTLYFTYTMYVLVPFLIKQFDVRNKYVFVVALMIILASFSIRQTWDYKFFWQEGTLRYGNTMIIKEPLPFSSSSNGVHNY